ncbi:unnamed protein product [Discosporangium mesarthrocarpum]
MASLKAVACLDTQPNTVEDLLYVCPQQACQFGGRHLRLVWVESSPTPGWRGRRGLARVQIDTALQPQDPAVFMLGGVTGAEKDPIVDLFVTSVPPHYIQPWEALEVIGTGASTECIPRGKDNTPSPLRARAALEILEGSVIRDGGLGYILASPASRWCHQISFRCRRDSRFGFPLPSTGVKTTMEATMEVGKQERRRGAREKMCFSGRDRHGGLDGGVQGSPEHFHREGGMRDGVVDGGIQGERDGEGERQIDFSGWMDRLHGWGFVTVGTTVVMPDPWIEVRYLDCPGASQGGSQTSVKMPTPSTSQPGLHDNEEADTIISSHEPLAVRKILASLKMAEHGKGHCEGKGQMRAPMSRLGGGGNLLIHGPAGVGKTLLVEVLAQLLGCRLVKVSPGAIIAGAGVEADRALRSAVGYSKTCVADRVVLLLDSLDRLFPKAEGRMRMSMGEVDTGLLNTLVLAVEQGHGEQMWEGRVTVVGVTSCLEDLHPTARRCFDQEGLLQLPRPLRLSILRRVLACGNRYTPGVLGAGAGPKRRHACLEAMVEVAGLCQGFTAGDMRSIAAATMHQRGSLSPFTRGAGSGEGQGRPGMLAERLRAAYRQVRGRVAASRGHGHGTGEDASVQGVPSVRWSEVGGLERAKQLVREMVVWPQRYPEKFVQMGISPPSGVLLFGPPGTGKTLLAKGAATETGATFIELKISDVVRGEIGESEKAVNQAFRTARELAPSIIFIDEFQALFSSRGAAGGTGSRLASQLLVCLDELGRWRTARLLSRAGGSSSSGGVGGGRREQGFVCAGEGEVLRDGGNVMVLAATNAPEAVDPAFLRPGRFDEVVYAGLPDAEGRRHILSALRARTQRACAESAGMGTRSVAVVVPGGGGGWGDPVVGGEGQGHFEGVMADDDCTLPAGPRWEERENQLEQAKVPEGESGGNWGSGQGAGAGGRWAGDVDLEWLSGRVTEGYSGADLSSLVRNAAMAAFQEVLDGEGRGGGDGVCGTGIRVGVPLEIAQRHFVLALAATGPSSSPEVVRRHESWAQEWGGLSL